jgi:NADH:ubiquinone oxidoreductase subunit 5 (subunit L)/multisubunit Na+/H+ antiporter MnhA subunit
MPWTGAVFCVGAVAIAGLPPLNGFASEFLILLAALSGIVAGDAKTAAGLIGVVGGLALIAALAAACFTKAFGLTFLGEPRAEAAARAHDPGLAMRLPMLLLAAACVVITPLVIAALPPVVELVSGGSATAVGAAMTSATSVLWSVALMGGGLSLLIALLSGLRRRLLAGRRVEERCTWDCGYARPSARMQYGAASFSQPLTDLFAPALQSHHHLMTPTGLFPLVAVSDSETPDVCMARFYSPLFSAIGRGMAALRWLQQGRVHLYVLYIALTLLVLLVWKLG